MHTASPGSIEEKPFIFNSRMFKNCFVFLLFLSILPRTSGQMELVDSLKLRIETAEEDSAKMKLYLDLSQAFYNNSWDSAIHYAQLARTIATKLEHHRGTALAYKNIGLANYFKGEPLLTIEAWENSLLFFEKAMDKQGIANILSNLGGVYERSDEARALDYYLRSLILAEEIGDHFRIATLSNNLGALYDKKPATVDKALENYQHAIAVSEQYMDTDPRFAEAMGIATGNMGEIYLKRDQVDSALFYFRIGEKYLQNKSSLPLALNNIGKAFLKKLDFATALKYQQQAYEEAARPNNKMYMTFALLGMADTYAQQGLTAKAIELYKKAESYALELNINDELRLAYAGLASQYSKTGDFAKAYQFQLKLTSINEVIYNNETDNKLANLRLDFDLKKKENEISLLSSEKSLQDLALNRQKLIKNALLAGLALVFLIIFILYRNYRQKTAVNKLLDKQKAEIENLVLNILPEEVALELRQNGSATPRYYESVSVMFTDFKGFTNLTDQMSPQEIVSELNTCFMAFDNLIEKYHLEKIKTIGDSYMCAGGIPTPQKDHCIRIMQAALEIQQYIQNFNLHRGKSGLPPWEIRIGIHIGPVVAGVVGKKKYAYDIWGSTVNIASRMESSDEPGKICISSNAYNLVKDKFECTYRGKINAKNIGDIDMYYLVKEIHHA